MTRTSPSHHPERSHGGKDAVYRTRTGRMPQGAGALVGLSVVSLSLHHSHPSLAALGLFGRFGPMIAALAMSLSSVTVVTRSGLLARLELDK